MQHTLTIWTYTDVASDQNIFIIITPHRWSDHVGNNTIKQFTHIMSLSFTHLRRPAIFAAIVNTACQSKTRFNVNAHAVLGILSHQTNFQE